MVLGEAKGATLARRLGLDALFLLRDAGAIRPLSVRRLFGAPGSDAQIGCRTPLVNPVRELERMSRPALPAYKTRNWPACNEALKRGGSLFDLVRSRDDVGGQSNRPTA